MQPTLAKPVGDKRPLTDLASHTEPRDLNSAPTGDASKFPRVIVEAGADLPVTVYTPESPLRRPARMVREMFRDLLASRELAWRLFVRDISAQYRQSILGLFWAFIPPLVAALPFVFLNSQGIIA